MSASKRIDVDTVGDMLRELSGLPPETKVRIYNQDAWSHTPVSVAIYGSGSSISITDTVILSSNVHVTVEDYD
jgi:hypothetical protein